MTRALLLLLLAGCGAGVSPELPAVDSNPSQICAVQVGWTRAQVADLLGDPCELDYLVFPPAGAVNPGWNYGVPACGGAELWWIGFDVAGNVAAVVQTDGQPMQCDGGSTP